MLNSPSSWLAIPEVLFPGEGTISTWVNAGRFKRMEVSIMGTFSGGVCLAYFLPSPILKPFSQLDLLFCSLLSRFILLLYFPGDRWPSVSSPLSTPREESEP